MRVLGFLSFLALGCTDGSGLIGDDNGLPLEPGDRVELGAVPASDPQIGSEDVFSGECHDLDAPVSSPALVATGGANRVDVVHEGITSSGDPGWVVYADVLDGNVIEVTYEETLPGDPTCAWEMRYTITSLPAGTWTVRARGDEATATVTGE